MQINPPKYKKFEDYFPNGLVEKKKVSTIVAEENIPQIREISMKDEELLEYRITIALKVLAVLLVVGIFLVTLFTR